MVQFWGRWLSVVAILHSLFALYWFRAPMCDMWRSGLLSSSVSAEEKLAIWFLLSGGWMLMLGVMVASLKTLPKAAALVLLLIVLMGLVLMPQSGFWLLLPPAVGLMWESYSRRKHG